MKKEPTSPEPDLPAEETRTDEQGAALLQEGI